MTSASAAFSASAFASRPQIKVIQNILSETFADHDVYRIFVAASAAEKTRQVVDDPSTIDVRLSLSAKSTFKFEECFFIFEEKSHNDDKSNEILAVSNINKNNNDDFLQVRDLQQKAISLLPFVTFDELWRKCFSSATSSLAIVFRLLRNFFAALRLHRDPRCLRFRESVRMERIFERKLFEANFSLYEELMTTTADCCGRLNHSTHEESVSSSSPVPARVKEAWMTVLDYYFYYFPEFRFPVADGQAADYSEVIKHPMSFFVMYNRIRTASTNNNNSKNNHVIKNKIKNNHDHSSLIALSSLLQQQQQQQQQQHCIDNKRSFVTHLELIAHNCILYNGSESTLARRANDLIESSFFRDASLHIPLHVQKCWKIASGTPSNSTLNPPSQDYELVAREIGDGEHFSLRWFNDALKPGQFVVAVAAVSAVEKNSKPKAKGRASSGKKTKKNTLRQILPSTSSHGPKKQVTGKRRKRQEVDDEDDGASSSSSSSSDSSDDDSDSDSDSDADDDADETTSTESSSDDDDEVEEIVISTAKRGRPRTTTTATTTKVTTRNTKNQSTATSVPPPARNTSKNVKNTTKTANEPLSHDQLQEVHSTLLAIWSSVTDHHVPRSEQVLAAQNQSARLHHHHQQQQQQQLRSANSIPNNHHGATTTTATTISPSIRRSITNIDNNYNNNYNNTSMMRGTVSPGSSTMTNTKNHIDSNVSNTQNGNFTGEAIQELASLKALSEMVDDQLKMMT